MSDETAELAERANEIFQRVVRAEVDTENDAQKFVVIDVETEDYEIDTNARAAFDRLIERHPAARGRTWLRRVGTRQAYRLRRSAARDGHRMGTGGFSLVTSRGRRSNKPE